MKVHLSDGLGYHAIHRKLLKHRFRQSKLVRRGIYRLENLKGSDDDV
jgi:hypothetical protein